MDAAALRIKFAPFIKNIRTCDSKCCVEIVPEVSGFRDLEKINWKIENDLIEYTIPMTYKIVIKKQEPVYCESELDRTYHSCVELLPNHSLSNVGLGSGDVMRIFSDNVVHNKLIPKTISNKNEEVFEDKETITKAASIHDTTSVSCANQAEELDKLLKEIEHLLQSKDGVPYEDQLRKLENLIEAGDFDEEIIKDLEPENYSPIITPKRNLSRYKLSLSPICSISTSENLSMGSKGSLPKTVNKLLHTTNCVFTVRGANNNVVLQAISTPSCASSKFQSDCKANNASAFPLNHDHIPSQVCSEKRSDKVINFAGCEQEQVSDHNLGTTIDQPKQDSQSDQKCQISRCHSEIRQDTTRNCDLSDTDYDKDKFIKDPSEGSPVLDSHTICDHARDVIFCEVIGEDHKMKSVKSIQKSLENFNETKNRNINKHSIDSCQSRTDIEQTTHLVSIDGRFDDVMFKNNAEKSSHNKTNELMKTNANNSQIRHRSPSPPTRRREKLNDKVTENNHEVRRTSPTREINRSVHINYLTSANNDDVQNGETTITLCPHVTGVSNQISKPLENFRIPERILPEIRVAEFVRALEMEFYPLKVMLSDIHSKCASMGLFLRNQSIKSDVKRVSEKLADSVSCDSTKYNVNKCSSDNSTRSNRVVYTITFKG